MYSYVDETGKRVRRALTTQELADQAAAHADSLRLLKLEEVRVELQRRKRTALDDAADAIEADIRSGTDVDVKRDSRWTR